MLSFNYQSHLILQRTPPGFHCEFHHFRHRLRPVRLLHIGCVVQYLVLRTPGWSPDWPPPRLGSAGQQEGLAVGENTQESLHCSLLHSSADRNTLAHSKLTKHSRHQSGLTITSFRLEVSLGRHTSKNPSQIAAITNMTTRKTTLIFNNVNCNLQNPPKPNKSLFYKVITVRNKIINLQSHRVSSVRPYIS